MQHNYHLHVSGFFKVATSCFVEVTVEEINNLFNFFK